MGQIENNRITLNNRDPNQGQIENTRIAIQTGGKLKIIGSRLMIAIQTRGQIENSRIAVNSRDPNQAVK
jgi:hypothetical protein